MRETGQTFRAVTRNEAALRNLVVDNATVFRTLSGRRDRIAETIQAFPTFLQESRATLRRVSTFSRSTTPLIQDLKPVLQDVQPTLASLRTLSPDLQQLFTDLRPLIAAGRTGLPALSNILDGLDPTLASTGPVLQQLNPVLQFLETEQSTISDFLGNGPSALALKLPSVAGSGTNGHALPQVIVFGSQTVPSATRTKDNRGNSYYAPGALTDQTLKDPNVFSLPSFDCDNAGGPKPPTDTPGCLVQKPYLFQGKLGKFPQVQESLPGGVTRGGQG